VGIRQQRSAVNDRMIAQFRREFSWVSGEDSS